MSRAISVYDSRGNLVWEMLLDVYGEVKECHGDRTFVPFRYQGQYEDEETGLYYNRFRYYSSEMGMYISSDPIGLAGNNPTLYGYVENVNRWVDPWGLATFDIVSYGCKTTPNENHHAILDVWAKHNIEGYVSRASHNPTIELTKQQHDATKRIYRDWLKEKTGKKVGGRIDWNKISPEEIFNLSERMFDAAGVPQSVRNKYYREFNKYIYTTCAK